MTKSESFNQSGFSMFINSWSGRILRMVVGLAFIVLGFIYREHTLGIISIVWGLIPLSAGAFGFCVMGAVLGGRLSGSKTDAK